MSDRTAETVPMDPETLEALKGSIAKWEGIVAGTLKDEGVDNCPLCQKFHACFRKIPGECCQGCPVNDASDNRGCINTPYDEWERHGSHEVTTDEHRTAAQAELDFLKSLLPRQTP
jgi:hypothetical protein